MVFKRGAQSHTKLIKAVVSTHKVGKNGKHKTSDVELTAVLLSANLVGAGFSMDKGIPINDLVTVTMAFFDKNGEKGVEILSGKVRWVRDYVDKGAKGYLFGIVWDLVPTKESNPLLYDYLDVTLRSY